MEGESTDSASLGQPICKDMRVLGEFEGGEDLPPDKGTTTSEIGFECPHLGLTQTKLTQRKRGKFGDLSTPLSSARDELFKYKGVCT